MRARGAVEAMEDLRRVRVRYEGRVQGVGFRYTVCRIAEGFPVTGYVRNEADGSVCLVAEGSEQTILDFLEGVRQSTVGRYIAAEQAAWAPPQGAFRRFGVHE